MSKVKFLVFWKESKETSILSKKDIKTKKNANGEEISQAKYDGKYYDIEIVAKNGK